MSVRRIKCPECKSTDIDRLQEKGDMDNHGKQPWLVLCRQCQHTWVRTVLVKRMPFVRY